MEGKFTFSLKPATAFRVHALEGRLLSMNEFMGLEFAVKEAMEAAFITLKLSYIVAVHMSRHQNSARRIKYDLSALLLCC